MSANRPPPTAHRPLDAGSFLDRFLNLERTRAFAYPLKLERMRGLLDLAGRPDRAFETILIAGTKGKGSTAHMLAAILSAHGISTGLYTSPHLESWRERIRAGGDLITEEEASGLAARLDKAMTGADFPYGQPTYFEVMTALACLHFEARGVQAAVLESGLGGEYDATNACEPVVSVITRLGMEHTEILGPRLEDIARAKCGILRRGVPCVIAPQAPEAARLIREHAAGVPLERILEENITDHGSDAAGQVFSLAGGGPIGPLAMGLLGRHQLGNAATALEAARVFLGRRGRVLNENACRSALAAVSIPARVERVGTRPDTILDTAHNAESAAALAAAVRRHFVFKRAYVILAVLADKDPRAILEPLAGLDPCVCATIVNNPRTRPVEETTRAAQSLGLEVVTAPDPAMAREWARGMAGAEDLVIIAGSFYLAGEMKRIWRHG